MGAAMKRIVLTAAFLASALGAAGAADLPLKTPPAAVPEVYNWTGFYAGGGLGYVYEAYDGSFVYPPAGAWVTDQDVTLGYAKAGAQYQFGNLGTYGGYGASFVLGVEGQYTAFIGGNTGVDTSGLNMTGDFVNNILSGGARGGIAWGRVMPYVTGGYAKTRVDNFFNLADGSDETTRTSHHGTYVGGGVDWMAMPHLLFTVEYRHYSFNTQTATPISSSTGAPVPGDTWTITPHADSVTVGIAYLFNWAGPVVAKY
jgi:outer membrane immunogenic protein